MAQTCHNLRLQIAKEQARSGEESALTCKKQTDPENSVKYSHDENCLINASRRRMLKIRNPFARSARLKGTVPGRGGSMGRHVIGRLRGPRWTRVRAQSFPRSYFRVLERFVQLHYKGLCGDSCWPDRAFYNLQC